MIPDRNLMGNLGVGRRNIGHPAHAILNVHKKFLPQRRAIYGCVHVGIIWVGTTHYAAIHKLPVSDLMRTCGVCKMHPPVDPKVRRVGVETFIIVWPPRQIRLECDALRRCDEVVSVDLPQCAICCRDPQRRHFAFGDTPRGQQRRKRPAGQVPVQLGRCHRRKGCKIHLLKLRCVLIIRPHHIRNDLFRYRLAGARCQNRLGILRKNHPPRRDRRLHLEHDFLDALVDRNHGGLLAGDIIPHRPHQSVFRRFIHCVIFPGVSEIPVNPRREIKSRIRRTGRRNGVPKFNADIGILVEIIRIWKPLTISERGKGNCRRRVSQRIEAILHCGSATRMTDSSRSESTPPVILAGADHGVGGLPRRASPAHGRHSDAHADRGA